MPQARDRILGELAVEQGLLTRDDAERYYSLLDSSPAAPPLSQLLLRDRRATAEDLVRLRDIWQDRQARGSNAPAGVAAAPAAPPPPAPMPRAPAPMPPQSGQYRIPSNPATHGGTTSAAHGGVSPPGFSATGSSGQRAPLPQGTLDPESLKRDEVLARLLVSRHVLTQDQAREARALQVKHSLRFGPVVLRKNFADRAQVEDAVQYLRDRVVLCSGCGAAHEKARIGPTRACPRCGGALVSAVSEDATPLVPTATPQRHAGGQPGAPRSGPGGEDPEAVTIRGAITALPRSLDPFASVRDNRVPGPTAAPAFASGTPTASFPPNRGGFAPAPQPPPQHQGFAPPSGYAPPQAYQPPPPFQPGRPMGPDDSRAALAASARGPAPSPWAPGPNRPPPPVRVDVSVDELEVFVPHGDQNPHAASVDELDPFRGRAAQGQPAAFQPATQFPSATPFPSAPFQPAEPFGGFANGGFAPGAPQSRAPVQSGYGIQAPAPAANGPEFGGFGSSPESRTGSAVAEPAEPAEPGAADADSGVPEGADSPEGDAPDDGPGPRETRVDRSRYGRKAPPGPARKSSLPLVLAVVCGLLVVGGLLTGVGFWLSKRARIDRSLASGDEAFEKKEWDKALSSYKLVLEDDHDNAQATKRRGECEQKLEELALEAEAKARIVKSRSSTNPDEALRILTDDSPEKKLTDDQKTKLSGRADVLVALAHAHMRLADDLARRDRANEGSRELEEAKKALDAAAATSPSPLLEVSLERIRYLERQRGRNPEVLTLLNEIAAGDPDGSAGAYARGRLALEGKSPKLDEALGQLESAVTNPKLPLPEAVFFRGKAKLAAARLAEARADFTTAMSDLPDDPRPAIELAKISLDKDNDPARSSKYVSDALARGVPDDPELLALQGEISVLQGQYAQALPKLNKAIQADSGLYRARRARAKAWVEVNKDKPPTPELEADLEAAIPRFPDDVMLHFYRALDRTVKRDWPGVIADFDVYLKSKDDDDVRLRRAYAYEYAGKYDEAIADCEWLIGRNKNNGNAIAERAINQLKKEDFASAVEGFTTVLGMATGPAAIQGRFLRGMAYLGCKKYKLAVEDFDAYLKGQPTGGDADKARHYIEQCNTAIQKEKGGGS